jgi:hypothetical protein
MNRQNLSSFLQELNKAKQYLEFEIEAIEKERNKSKEL